MALTGSGCSADEVTRARPARGAPAAAPPPTAPGPTLVPKPGSQHVGGQTHGPRWPGHRPGRTYLGLSYPDDIANAEAVLGPVGVHRSYFEWDDIQREAEVIADDHANRRLPWVSFKAPGDASGWGPVARGVFDDQLRARARHYASFSEPIVVTFHHEPSNERPQAGSDYAAAWVHVHDVMRAEAGLHHVAQVPIIGDWEFNPANVHAAADEWITRRVLERASFLGVDVYQNASGETYAQRLARVQDWLVARGHPGMMIGVGETGCTDAFGSPTAVQWWTESWAWVELSTDTVGVVAYYDSDRNSRGHVHWPLDESAAKQRAFKLTLKSPTACRLPAG